jgi:acetyl esterase
MDVSEEEGTLDPWVAEWTREHPLPDLSQPFSQEVLELARSLPVPAAHRHIDNVTDEVINGVPVRIYRNHAAPTALVLYFHGGAFVLGSVNLMDGLARELTHATGAVVVSVDYRLAWEAAYPAPLDDCLAVTKWALEHASRFDLPPTAVVVAGESAGGNLAAAVALKLRDEGNANVAGQVLVYPVTDGPTASYPSREQFGRSEWMWKAYGGGRDISNDPYAVPMRAASLVGLPPAIVLLAGCDALRDEGRAYARRLLADGVDVEEHCAKGQPHGFLNFELPAAGPAYEQITHWVRRIVAEQRPAS